MKRFNVTFEYVDKKWVASCNELRIRERVKITDT